MENLKISTDVAVQTASRLRELNGDMDQTLSQVQTAVDRLGGTWEGQAADRTLSDLRNFQAEYAPARYQVLENFANFLLQQVGQGYENTEDVNKALADAFK